MMVSSTVAGSCLSSGDDFPRGRQPRWRGGTGSCARVYAARPTPGCRGTIPSHGAFRLRVRVATNESLEGIGNLCGQGPGHGTALEPEEGRTRRGEQPPSNDVLVVLGAREHPEQHHWLVGEVLLPELDLSPRRRLLTVVVAAKHEQRVTTLHCGEECLVLGVQAQVLEVLFMQNQVDAQASQCTLQLPGLDQRTKVLVLRGLPQTAKDSREPLPSGWIHAQVAGQHHAVLLPAPPLAAS
mmetsp:Transcript_17260/g.50296  ORF Transcript_17260/g.50296 Transcript_17260/m.50296 type:complete len:240 (-) Transcript_17260:47-766(-)